MNDRPPPGEGDLRGKLQELLISAALPGATRITYELAVSKTGESAALRSYDARDAAIGDERTYDILKSYFQRARRCAEAIAAARGQDALEPGTAFSAALDLQSGKFDIALSAPGDG